MESGKKVVEEVSGWMRVFDDGSVDRTWTGPPEVKFMSDPVLAHDEFIDGVAVKDVVIDAKSGLRVRMYVPQHEHVEGAAGKLPILLHFPGGGFCISQADWYMYYAVYTRLARAAGAVVVSVYLRLAPEHRLPAAIDDGFSALLWLRSLARGEEATADSRDLDFSLVFLIGDSSGGNIVYQVAVRGGAENMSPLRVAGAIPIHPGFCRSVRRKSELEQPESPFLTLDMVDKFLKMALPLGSNKDHPITCPMGDAAPKLDGLNIPPFLYFVAELDLIKDTEMEFYEAMKKAGKDVTLFINSGVSHSFYLNKIAVDMDPVTGAETQKLFSAIVEFMKKH